MAEELRVELRPDHGKHHTRRLRRAGSIPAILYGHGQESIALSVLGEDMETALRHGGRLVSLTGAVSESAFIREFQWDTFGTHILHVDFTRISAHEKVQLTVTIECRGEAPGVKEGGVIDQLLHDVELECPAGSIPDKLYVKINNLKLGESITVAGLEVPEGARILAEPDVVVVQCVEPAPEVEIEAPAEAAPGEPELVGRKKEEEAEEE